MQIIYTFLYLTLVSAIIFVAVNFIFLNLLQNTTIKVLLQKFLFVYYDSINNLNYSTGNLKNKLLTTTSGCSLRSKRTIYFKK